MSNVKLIMIVFGGIALVVAAIVGYVYWDARTNYTPVQARVTAVDENVCVLHRRSRSTGSGRRRSSDTTDPMSCDEASRLERTSRYRDYQVQERKRIAYLYTSPVDNREYPGELIVERPDYPDVREGGGIEIFAHETDPARSRRPI